jgi:transcriptional regulator with XRE-family HTH domain
LEGGEKMYLGKLEIGKVIRRLRMERQLSIEDVAKLIDEDVEFIHELEDGMYSDISLDILCYLADTFNTEPYELMFEIEKENIEYIKRIKTFKRNKYKLRKQKDKQRKLVLQKKKTHNFKNKLTKHPFKRKINTIENGPTTSILALRRKHNVYLN